MPECVRSMILTDHVAEGRTCPRLRLEEDPMEAQLDESSCIIGGYFRRGTRYRIARLLCTHFKQELVPECHEQRGKPVCKFHCATGWMGRKKVIVRVENPDKSG